MSTQISLTPDFKKTFLIPSRSNATVILRFCAPFGGGLDENWKTPIPPFAFIMNELPVPMKLLYSFHSTNMLSPDGLSEVAYIDGQRGGGFDQHSQYYQHDVSNTTDVDSFLYVTGNYPLTGYMSIVVYFKDARGNIYRFKASDKDMLCGDEGMNPFTPGNPSIYSYVGNTKNTFLESTISKHNTSNNKARSLRAGEVSIYRPDYQTSLSQYDEYLCLDRISGSYLYATKDEGQDVLILRIKVPTTFVSSTSPDLTFGKYQSREISVSSNILETDMPSPLLDFWTVSSLMLNMNKDSEGYAYVFFAPTDFVAALVSDTTPPTPDNTPPILTWGEYTGYVLGTPTAAIFVRYFGMSEDWLGNIENVSPYPAPATKDMIGDYLPELFGDTMDNFMNGSIGAVNKNMSWPS